MTWHYYRNLIVRLFYFFTFSPITYFTFFLSGNARADSVYSQNINSTGTVLKMKANEGVNANRFMWKIPKLPKASSTHVNIEQAYKSCVLRVRYYFLPSSLSAV